MKVKTIIIWAIFGLVIIGIMNYSINQIFTKKIMPIIKVMSDDDLASGVIDIEDYDEINDSMNKSIVFIKRMPIILGVMFIITVILAKLRKNPEKEREKIEKIVKETQKGDKT